MKRSTFAVFGVAAMVLVFGTTAQADTLWGVTNGTNENFYTGGQIFTVDTATGSVSVKASYGTSTVLAFGDIAVRDNGEVYVTYYGEDGFDKLAKVNTSTWGFDWVQDLGVWNDQVNALEFIDGTLYGVTGGGIPANLIQFTLTGSGATATNLGSLGTNSDGDIAKGPDGQIYYTSWETGNTSELNVVTLSPVEKTGKEIATSNGWSGLVASGWDLFATTWQDQKLYTLDYNTSNSTYTATMVWDLSTPLGGNITGLSAQAVPEPGGIVALVGLGAMGLIGLVWRRRRAA